MADANDRLLRSLSGRNEELGEAGPSPTDQVLDPIRDRARILMLPGPDDLPASFCRCPHCVERFQKDPQPLLARLAI